MPKRPADGRGGGRTTKRRRRNLYLVMDDWERGYSIRKVDLGKDGYGADSDTDEQQQQGSNLSDDDTIEIRTERRLPPVVLRLEAPRADSRHFAAAFGTKIMALQGTRRRVVPIFDVRNRGLSFGPRVLSTRPICVPIGDKLFFLDEDTFKMLPPPPPPLDPDRFALEWSWCDLPRPPFNRWHVTSHAVHPDGRTIFVSTEKGSRKRNTAATFTFDTAAGVEPSQWKRHGEWKLPFKGCAHFDHELDAWVGLSGDPDTLGHLCSCDVLFNDDSDGGAQPPARRLSKEKLFCEDPAEKHIGATLVYMGGRSKFCLVQCLCVDDREEGMYKEYLPPKRTRHLLRLTTFSLKYDKNGDLRTATHRRVRSYELPKAATEYDDVLENPVAFWM